MPEPRKDIPELVLEVNVPVLVRPWKVRVVQTKPKDRDGNPIEGTVPKVMFVVKEGDQERELKWLHIDTINELTELGAVKADGTWPDGNPKYTVPARAPELVVCKRQPAGEKWPHTVFALAAEDSGPEMPQKPPVSPATATTPAGRAPVAPLHPDRPEPDAVHHACIGFGITQALRIGEAMGDPDSLNDPLVVAALISVAGTIANTAFIGRSRG